MHLSARFEHAFQYAAIVHAGQMRKATTIPYLSHLMAVASLVLEHGGDEEEAIAALLHDAIEDAGGKSRREDLRVRFGDRVAAIVDGCTDTDATPKPPWRQRKEAYIAHLRGAALSTLLVSCCDKLHNARSIVSDLHVSGEATWTKFNGGRDGTLWYYSALLAEFQSSPLPKPLVAELSRTIAAMQSLSGA